MCADSSNIYRTKAQDGSGNRPRGRKSMRKDNNVFFDGTSPVSVRQEKTTYARQNSVRRKDEEYSGGSGNSSLRSRDEGERRRPRMSNSSIHSTEQSRESRSSRSQEKKPTSVIYKSSSQIRGNADLQRSGKGTGKGPSKGEAIYRNGTSSSKGGSGKGNSRGSYSSTLSGKLSNSPSSRASSTTSPPSGKKKNSGKPGNRKLDAKVFALSMELIEHVSKGRLELAEKKIKQGASPDYADYDKRTPLHLAASEGHVELVTLLLDYGANPEVEDRWGSKPYDDAVKHDFKEITDILRQYCQPDDEDTLGKEHHDGLELLEYCARGFERLVREKIAAGTKPTFADYDRRTPLHLAASEGHAKIAEILLNNGADATFKDRFGHTPVDDAMRNGFLDVLATMKKKGVEIPAHIFDMSHTPEFQRNMRLIDVCARGKIGMVHKLLQEGADPKFGDYDMRTPLHLACAEGHASIVRLLISAGADISAEDRWSSTPFEEAMKYEHTDVVRSLEQMTTASPATTIA